MAVLFPRSNYSNTILEGELVGIPANGKSYLLECDTNDFTEPTQGLRIELWESFDNGASWEFVTSGPARLYDENGDPLPDGQQPLVPGGLDRFGDMRKPSLDVTDIAQRGMKARIFVLGTVNMTIHGTTKT